jgi:quercetin dioxygenase-like cupin family protein
MKKTNIHGNANQRKVNPNWFTNKVWMKVLSEKIKSKEQDIYHVHFQNGAKTKLHSHNGSQILIVTEGNGSLEIFRRYGANKKQFKIKKTKTTKLNAGDIVYITAKTLHTHGSINKRKMFSHIAINILPTKNSIYKTDWYESDFKSKVTEKIE